MLRVFMAVCLSVYVSPALAQSAYIGAALGVETSVVGGFEYNGDVQPERGGTTALIAVRAGIGLGERWGAEVELAHALTLETSAIPAGRASGGTFPVATGAPVGVVIGPAIYHER